MKILIIQTAFIGDVILATPLIEKLAKKFPGAQIDFLLRKGNENLLHNHPKLNKVFIWNKKQNKFLNLLKIIFNIRKSEYDWVINLHRFMSTGIITVFSGAKKTCGFDKNPLSLLFKERFRHEINGVHEIERNLSLIKSEADNTIELPKLYPSDEDYKSTEEFKTKPYVCIAPTSVWFTKQLPIHKWIELIHKFSEETNIYLLGGETDINACSEIVNQVLKKNVVNLAGQLTLLQTAALMGDSKMNYVNDSAPLHMASAVNAPVTAFFCSTIPAFGFGPLSAKSKIVEIKEKLNCRPCGLHGFMACPLQHFNCAKKIEITNELVV